tara:strand:+ start:6262 stop:6456 length:195 start_codon:yes stop_codon:yes gene_type:complete
MLTIDLEKIGTKVTYLKKNFFSVYTGRTIYYNKPLGIAPSGYQWFTEIVMFGKTIRIVKRTIHF